MRTPYLLTPVLLVTAAAVLAGCSGTEEASSTSAPDASCTPAHPDVTTITEGVLTVAQYPYAPFSIYEDGELTGVEGDVMTRIAEMECLTIEVVPGESAAMITSVQNGRADTTLGSWYRTAAREEVVLLSDPVVTSPLSLISTTGADTADEIAAMTIGVGQGLTNAENLAELLGDNLKTYPSGDAAMADFQAGRVDGVIMGLGAAVEQLNLHPVDGASIMPIQADERIPATVDIGQTNFPVNQSNEALVEAINDDIAEIRSSGELAEIAEKYDYPVDATEPGEPNLL
ncbi:amino acid ABC transporter substrate-binding protein [Labedella phragmitis]|uniref:Amino acid ABC transporter substrate-binding protein n=2 Tax=Labedella TaxID=390250 RepID=A0A3S4ASD3_9MICO|nr:MULTISPECIES: transporter substrate-binding domain-containing protein [Labedella]RWZ46056.1 amino acid ABC transporter substrate-binding protein [Labedella phragmitis]RWZ54826.1 amino acid ABC transporter substrate-binding protein [Labedella populi]